MSTNSGARVLVVTALAEERAAFWRRRVARDIVIAATGEGPRKATRAATALCDGYRPALLVGAGVAGALSTDLVVGDIVVARRILDASGDAPSPDAQLVARAAALPGVRLGTLLSVDRPLVAAAEKAEWAEKVGEAPAAVDMESAAWARVASAHGIPFLVIRAVSDDAFEELPGYLSRCMDRNGGIRRWAVAMHALAQPSTIPKLRRMQRRVRDCTDRLASFVEHFLAGVA